MIEEKLVFHKIESFNFYVKNGASISAKNIDTHNHGNFSLKYSSKIMY